jgi:hypothetical protein
MFPAGFRLKSSVEDLVSTTGEDVNARGIRGSVAVYRGGFYCRGVYTDANGTWAQRRVKLDVAAVAATLQRGLKQ